MLNIQIYIREGLIKKVSISKSLNKKLSWKVDSDEKLHNKLFEKWFEGYLQKKYYELPLPLDWSNLSPFTKKVLLELMKIPFGATKSYGEIASLVGSPRAARAVGTACGQNPFLLFVPCHRVIGSDRKLRGFAAGLELKVLLLDYERLA